MARPFVESGFVSEKFSLLLQLPCYVAFMRTRHQMVKFDTKFFEMHFLIASKKGML